MKKLRDGLAADKGGTLDHEYMAQIVPASTVAVNLFKDESSKGENPKFVQFAKQMLPKIEKHQKMAVQLSQNLGIAQAKKEQAPGQPTQAKKEQPPGQPASGSSAPPPLPAQTPQK